MSAQNQAQQLAAQQHVLAEFNKAQARILPAKLADIPSNGLHVSAYITQHGLIPSAENFYAAINALFDKLQWVVAPAKLKARKINELGLEVLPDQQKDQRDRAELRVATEAADAKAKADAKTFQRIDDAINGLSLHFKSATADQQARLRRYVAQQKAGNKIPETIFAAVKNEIERLYAEESRQRERM